MMLTNTLAPEFVDTFPVPMRPAVLYVSILYRTTGHLCCCGCGEEVIAPLSPAQWKLTYDGETVSLDPSIGNWSLPCQSHYVIRRNQVSERRQFTPQEISANRANDRALFSGYEDAGSSNDEPLIDYGADESGERDVRNPWSRLLGWVLRR
ncbi:DUF6527 family protein [Rhodococcoides fascians]|uniref:DUF6527 family protein n=1 Tax=Rhodococcoides fascians TaxID=1828 RepID=UPI000560ECF3|nr:DUF6527 family protein [Rhodococcus fascians]